jgi:type III restriction enzyme
VEEVLEIENRIYSYPVIKRPDYNFNLHNIDYNKLIETEEFKQDKEYEFKKGFITLIRQSPALERTTTYDKAVTGERREKKTLVRYKMFTVSEIVEQLQNRLKSIDMEMEDSETPTNYAKKFNAEWLTKMIKDSLKRINEKDGVISDENRQKIYQAFGVIHRPSAKVVRYKMTPKALETFTTNERHKNSVGLSSIIKAEATIFWDDNSLKLCEENERNFIHKLLDDEDNLPGAAQQKIENTYNFKTPLGIVISDHKPERGFVRAIVKQENSKVIDAWIKSTDQDFYKIEYAWKKGEHPKRASFNPDFFIKVGNVIMVAEIKGDEEISNPSDENKAKWKAAKQHFNILNEQQKEIEYHFNFLTPEDYDYYFDSIRKKKYQFTSKLDAELEKNGFD